MRMQFYPSKNLESCLFNDAANKNISCSSLIVSILEEYYQNSPAFPPFAQLFEIICQEVSIFLTSKESNWEFSLSDASKTYQTIPMTSQGKPNPLRMRIGKAFNKQITSGNFNGIIKQVFLDNKKPKRDKNRAALYVKLEQL